MSAIGEGYIFRKIPLKAAGEVGKRLYPAAAELREEIDGGDPRRSRFRDNAYNYMNDRSLTARDRQIKTTDVTRP